MKISLPSSAAFQRHLILTLFLLSGATFLALGLETLDDLGPGFLSAHLRGQLHGFGHLSLWHFVLIPGVPAVALLSRTKQPTRWMSTAGGLWALGALLLGFAFLFGGLESGWAVALSQPMTRSLVSSLQILALLFATLSAELLALQLLALCPSPASRDYREAAPAVAARVLALALPLQASALLLGLIERVSGMDVFIGLGASALPALLHAWSWTPLAVALVLLATASAAERIAPMQTLPTGLWPMVVGGLSFVAVQHSLLTTDVPSFATLSWIGLNCLLSAAAWALGFRLLPSLFSRKFLWTPARVFAVATFAFTGALIPLSLWTNLLPANGGFPFNPWITLAHSALALAAGFSVLARFSVNIPLRNPLRLSLGVLVGAALVLAVLWIRALSHMPTDIAVPGADRFPLSSLLLTAAAAGLICLAGVAPGFRRE